MLSLRWDQIVGEGNEHISRDPAVKAQPARGSIPLEYLDIFVGSRARCVYIRRRNPSPFIPLLSPSLSPSPLLSIPVSFRAGL